MKYHDYHIVYFVGIGGIGMSAIARWFATTGTQVYGYDKTPSPVTDALQGEGIKINFEDDVDHIPVIIKENKEKCLIIYTPAIPATNRQFRYLKEEGYVINKRSEVLGEITKRLNLVAVAGTHGKTTTSSLITHLFKVANKKFVSFMGGIPSNHQSNLIINGMPGEIHLGVVEADEFDRSFHRLHPDYAIVTSADPDHLDIYGDFETMKKSYTEFVNLLSPGGRLLINERIQNLIPDHRNDLKVKTYGLKSGDIRSENIHIDSQVSQFDYLDHTHLIENLRLPQHGFHNIENALAAIHCALGFDISDEKIREGLNTYKGIRRRFEFLINRPDQVFIDDYAHHPEEIKALLNSVRAIFPDKRITAVFQPHLYTRTRDFKNDFAKSLDLADQVILLDIYPAREEPISGISSKIIYDELKTKEKQILSKEALIEGIREISTNVIVTIGAGDIDRLILPIKKELDVT